MFWLFSILIPHFCFGFNLPVASRPPTPLSPLGVARRALGFSAAARSGATGRLRVVEDQGKGAAKAEFGSMGELRWS